METFEAPIYLRNTHYQRALQVICQILKGEVNVAQVSKSEARDYLSKLLEFIKGKPINLKSDSIKLISKYYFNEVVT